MSDMKHTYLPRPERAVSVLAAMYYLRDRRHEKRVRQALMALGVTCALLFGGAYAEYVWIEPDDNFVVFLCGERVEGFFVGTTVDDLIFESTRCDRPIVGPQQPLGVTFMEREDGQQPVLGGQRHRPTLRGSKHRRPF